MAFQFTPGVERAFAAAARWVRSEDGLAFPIGTVEALLGLLGEPECRAAKLLAAQAIDQAAVLHRWPEFSQSDDPMATFAMRGLSAQVEASLRDACAQLDESPRSFQWSTEHVLLGLTLADDDVGAWLREQGLDADRIERDQARLYGGDRTPIAVDPAPIPLEEEPSSRVPRDARPAERVASDAAKWAHRTDNATLRVIDAAANRAGEAIRVLEDYVRFVLDDARLVEQCKELRHDLTAALASVSMVDRLAARDTAHDVGTTISIESEMTRRDPGDVAAANIRRLQESLRSLEEFAKLIDPQIAAYCEQLRYRSYELHRTLGAAAVHDCRRSRLVGAKLYVLIDGRASEDEFVRLVRSLVVAGVDVLQLRDKTLDDRTLLARAHLLREAITGSRTLFIMNDRADLAVAAGADGVHVGQNELPVAAARQIVGSERLIGVSTHSIEQARQAETDGADYIGVGPTFTSGTKTFAAFPGLEFVRAVANEISLPAFAIGGIGPDNVDEVLAAGLRRVAVSGSVVNAGDPAEVASLLRLRLQ